MVEKYHNLASMALIIRRVLWKARKIFIFKGIANYFKNKLKGFIQNMHPHNRVGIAKKNIYLASKL